MYINDVKLCIYIEENFAALSQRPVTPSTETHLTVDSLGVDRGPVSLDRPRAQLVLVLSRLPLVEPPRGDRAVALGVRRAGGVATSEPVCEVRAVDVLVGRAEVGDGGLDLVAGRVELGLVVDGGGLGRVEADRVAGAVGRQRSAVCSSTVITRVYESHTCDGSPA